MTDIETTEPETPARFRIIADGRTVEEIPGASYTTALRRADHLTRTTHILHTISAN